VSDRARIWRDPADGMWLVQLAGRATPSFAAATWPGALLCLEGSLVSDEWWKRQDPLVERYTPEPSPRLSSFAGPRPRSSLWEYLGSRRRTA
jgi:hypothetical protein